MRYSVKTKKQLIDLWTETYNNKGKPDWSHILPYYDKNIRFRDSIQEIRGKKAFTEMTERLARRSGELEMSVVNSLKTGNVIFMEWEMRLSYKKYPKSTLCGASRITLNASGKIIEQRDYFDLWGDIFDHIPWLAKRYRIFMKKKFG
jgi:hypothetical protein